MLFKKKKKKYIIFDFLPLIPDVNTVLTFFSLVFYNMMRYIGI